MKKQEEIDFWPGFVDALMNLVLNLLFLSAVFAIAIFVLGMESSRLRHSLPESMTAKNIISAQNYESNVSLLHQKRIEEDKIADTRNASQDADTVSITQSEKKEIVLKKTLVINVSADASKTKNGLKKSNVVIKQENEYLFSVFYPADVSTLNGAEETELKTFLLKSFNSKNNFKIWGTASIGSAASHRLTYLRVMSIRNALISAGYPAERIVSANVYGGDVNVGGVKVFILSEQ